MLSSVIFGFLLLFAISNAALHDPAHSKANRAANRPQMMCPCVCRSGPMRVMSTRRQCERRIFQSHCVHSMCKQDNPRRSPGYWCCDPAMSSPSLPSPSPSVSPTLSPTPSLLPSSSHTPTIVLPPSPSTVSCPCKCRTGPRQARAAKRECENPRSDSRCKVESCMRGMSHGTQCCDPERTVKPTSCPCFCRTGHRAQTSSAKECARLAKSSVCAVSACTRPAGAKGFQCCDP